jgi:pimeloyl-ACP methyl ester carboxylesterase
VGVIEQQGGQMKTVLYKTTIVEGLSVFYREAGESGAPKLLLLHGFPASSHQYRNLIPTLADKFHIVAPDYPGFGNSSMPDPARFPYTFDRLSRVVEALLVQLGFSPFGLYMQDYGGPVGFRIITRHPEWAEWLIVQNTNAYEEGFTPAWDALRYALWKKRGPETEEPLLPFLGLEGIRMVYLHGHKQAERISPDNWNMDFRFMERPGARRVQLDLFYDYRTNVELYPQWQQFLRQRQPKTLIFWGQKDIFFTREGGEAYLRDVPNAEMHRLDSGHFATEDSLEEIAGGLRGFYEKKVKPVSEAAPARKAA